MTIGVEIYGRNLEVSERIQTFVEKKVSKLDRYLSNIEDVRVELAYVKSARSARGLPWCHPVSCADPYAVRTRRGERDRSNSIFYRPAQAVSQKERRAHLIHKLLVNDPAAMVGKCLSFNKNSLCSAY